MSRALPPPARPIHAALTGAPDDIDTQPRSCYFWVAGNSFLLFLNAEKENQMKTPKILNVLMGVFFLTCGSALGATINVPGDYAAIQDRKSVV